MLAGNQENIAEPLLPKGARFTLHLFHSKGHAQNRIIARKTAIFAIVDAFVREVERSEKPDYFAKPLLRQALSTMAKRLQHLASGGRNQMRKALKGNTAFGQTIPHSGGGGRQGPSHQALQREGREFSSKAHLERKIFSSQLFGLP
jgi:hypothetical protein